MWLSLLDDYNSVGATTARVDVTDSDLGKEVDVGKFDSDLRQMPARCFRNYGPERTRFYTQIALR